MVRPGNCAARLNQFTPSEFLTGFSTKAGRFARTMGSRLQNILISSAAISLLYNLHDDRPHSGFMYERLGEWRRGWAAWEFLAHFGPERGVVLFETAEAVALKPTTR